MKRLSILSLLAAATALTLGGCASLPPSLAGGYQSSADAYNINQAQQAQQVRIGQVIAVRHVEIQTTKTAKATGSGIGALIGALAGHQIGSGNGKTAATAVGALAGAVAGNKAAAVIYKQPGLAITVKLRDGEAIEITQAADVRIAVGQRVEVISGGYGEPVRVVPLS